MDDDEEEYDEEAMIAKALAMSMPENEQQPQPENEEPKQELKDIMTTDFMKGIIDDLDLDVDEDELDEIVDGVPGKDKNEEAKKEDDPDKKD
jgi:hypothetical protein